MFVANSTIPSAGRGLFAAQRINKGDDICIYSGHLVDPADCKYLDPSYMVEFELGKGFKLNGDALDGDLGIYANAIHPSGGVLQNARFDLRTKAYRSQGRGCFLLKATKDINPQEEIIVSYGRSYWMTLDKWRQDGAPPKPIAVLARNERAEKRGLRFQ